MGLLYLYLIFIRKLLIQTCFKSAFLLYNFETFALGSIVGFSQYTANLLLIGCVLTETYNNS